MIGWQVSCVMTSSAEIARLDLPNVSDKSSDGYNLLKVEKETILKVSYITDNEQTINQNNRTEKALINKRKGKIGVIKENKNNQEKQKERES